MITSRIIFIFLASIAIAHADETLQEKVQGIAAEAQGKVSMACSLPGSSLSCELDPHARPPMQSVFKLPLAMTVLHQVEQGKFSLNQSILFAPGDRFVPHAYSPLQDQYPEAGVKIPLRELLQRAVSQSDNVAADILLREAGGVKVVGDYMGSLGVTGFHLVNNEHEMHRDESLQYRNWFEPAAAVQLLRRISDAPPLSTSHTQLLLSWMRSATISKRLGGELPKSATIAHKTGTSGVVDGLAAATNDIGLITLPDGRQLAIAIFITDSRAGDDARDRIIARIGKAVYDAAARPAP